jgi:DHA2 family multidrug resistance protein
MGVGNSLFNLGRQFGGSLGIALFTTLFEKLQHLNRGELVRHVSEFSVLTSARLEQLQQLLVSRGTLESLAPSAALRLLDLDVGRQALMSAFNQVYMVFACGVLISLLAVPIMTTGRPRDGGAAVAH